MVKQDQPHSRYQHLFVVVRFDERLELRNAVSLVSAWATRASAEAEATRLRDLVVGDGSFYHVVVTRLKEGFVEVTQDSAF